MDTMPQRQILFRTSIYPHLKGTDCTPLIMVPDMGDISAGHSAATVPTMTEAAVLEGTPDAPLPATAAAHAALWLMDTPITTCTMTPTGIVTPHPTLATSPTDVSHATTETGTSLAPATPTAQHRNLSPEKPNSAQDPQSSINPLFKDCDHPGFPFKFFT